MFEAKRENPTLAIALMLCATVFIAGSTAFAKALGSGALGAPIHALQVTHGRFLFAGLGFLAAVAVLRPVPTKIHWGLHLKRTALGWGGVTLMFAAVAFIPLADATAISFLNPVFAMIFAIPFLGERVGPVRWAAAAMAFLGALVLLRPGSGAFEPAALLALAAAVLLGFEVVFIKQLSGREGALQILLVNNLVGVSIATIAVIPVFVMPTAAQWIGLLGVGGCMAMAQTCYVNAVSRADASFVAPFSYATLICAAVIDLVVFDVTPVPVSVLGAAIILSAGVMLAWREGVLRKRAAKTT